MILETQSLLSFNLSTGTMLIENVTMIRCYLGGPFHEDTLV